MAEEANFGVARLRQAITNQATCGSGQFELSIGSADELCREIEAELDNLSRDEDELARLSWAKGVPAPRDADGEVVPLTTKVMYTGFGDEITLKRLMFYYSNFRKCFVWHVASQDDAIFSLNILHLTCPDSWERLEKDVSKAEDKDICGYFGFAMNRPCSAECPARDAHDSCAVIALRDVMRRAKALAERDAKGASRG